MKRTDYSAAKSLEEVMKIQDELFRYPVVKDQHARARLDTLEKYAKECTSIKELGVYQGSSFIAMMMQGCKKATAIDIDMKWWYQDIHHLAKKYAYDHEIELEIIEDSSLNPKIVSKVDMLHIDSLHYRDHLMKELQLHAPSVKKFIMFHDILQRDKELWKCLLDYIGTVPNTWEVVEQYTEGKCGYAVIERIKWA